MTTSAASARSAPGHARSREIARTVLATSTPPRRVRLLKFTTDFVFGGTERQFIALSRQLDSKVFQKHVACFRRQGRFLDQIEETGIPVLEFPIHRLYDPRTAAMQLRFVQALRRLRIDVVHTYGFYPNVFAAVAAKMAGCLVIGSIRDQGDIWSPLQRTTQRMLLKTADAVIVNAEAVKQRLVDEGYDASRLVVIRNGVDLAAYRSHTGDSVRRALGLPREVPIVGTVSRLHSVKGLADFVDAAAVLHRRFPKARFVIAGEGPEEAALRGRVASLGLEGCVHFTGYCSDVPELLAQLQVFVLSSHSEALPNTVLEAMASKLPVVATRVGGTPELVDEGVTGLLAPPRAPMQLAEAMGSLLEHPERAREMGLAGGRRAEHFSMSRLAEETGQLYLRLLQRRTGAHVPTPRLAPM